VIVCDLGDNTSAGATGDLPYCLEQVLHDGEGSTHVCPVGMGVLIAGIWDPEVVTKAMEVGENGILDNFFIGGKFDTTHGKPLHVKLGTVQKIR